MLLRPMKRICPSLSCMARSKTRRQCAGLMKGSNPSTRSISANAPKNRSARLAAEPKVYFFARGAGAAGITGATDAPRMAWKNSLLGSTTTTSDLVLKLAR